MSLRLRLTLWYGLVLSLVLAGFGGAIFLTLRGSLYAAMDESLETRVDDLAAWLAREGSLPPAHDPDDECVRLYDLRGQVTWESGRARTHFRILRKRLDDGRTLEVGRSDEDVRDTLSLLLSVLGPAYPIAVGVALAGGAFLAGRALAPIDALTSLARRISAEDLSQRLDSPGSDDELGRLAGTFNAMIERLEEAFQRQRRFTADASHELRTPLAVMRGHLEVALQGDRAAEDYRRVLTRLGEEVGRLIRLVSSLLTLARADSGQIPLHLEPLQAEAVVSGAVEQVRPLAAERGVSLSVEPGPDIVLQADEDLLLQLLLNLLDNAIKNTPRGGLVTAGWGAGRVWVRDTGVGVSPEDQARLFDRFFRVDRSRTRDTGGT
ncbi:MAG: histidine kinase dimerization/phospho-acceptor domain-containing protein, partial [Candidatus Eremiobacterota bacterium]